MSIPLLILLADASSHPGPAAPVIPWARIVLAFLFCIALAIGAILWLRSRQGMPVRPAMLWRRLLIRVDERRGEPMAIEQRLRVTPTGQFIVLNCDGRRYLLHVGTQQAQLLDRLEDAEIAVETPP